MAEAIFHIGMGKTGTSSIQAALLGNSAALEAARTRYMGMWMEHLDPAFGGFAGFLKFRDQPQENFAPQAERLARMMEEAGRDGGPQRFIFSNEAYLPLLGTFRPFFAALAELVDLRIVAYARPAGSWLPSACAQWALLHKTNAGPIETLGEAGTRLMVQYEPIPQWHDMFGDRMVLRLFHQGIDILEDFSTVIGVPLGSDGFQRQARLPISDQILRAAINNQMQPPCLPDLAERVYLPQPRGGLTGSVSGKFRHLFDNSQLRPVIDAHAPMLREIEAKTGIDLISEPIAPTPAYDAGLVADELIGSLLDITARQALQLRRSEKRIGELETRLEALEKRLSGG
ncbi:hypothetical protein [Mangrovicoccus sp. HB161399]|uniref:hypothetical protein n=1 Tax=Mangrovicoccus sp. HB161399 TaxID=2720392 RepID=UPI0015537F3D|nr:hypothetical protein [Mangrovicoccus sp. HB161399]